MNDLMTVGWMVLLLALSAVLAMAETTIVRTGRVKALHLAQEKKRGAASLVKLVEDPAPHLNVLGFLLLLTHVGIAALAIHTLFPDLEGSVQVLAVVATAIVVFVLAQLVPRTVTVQFTERIGLGLAPAIHAVTTLLKPLGALLIMLSNAVMLVLPGRSLPKGPSISEEELHHLSGTTDEEEEIEEEERELIHSIFEFGDTIVREVMVPRPDMVAIPSEASIDEALAKIIEAGYSRIPIFEGDTDNIIGVLYAKDLLKRVHEGKKDVKLSSLGRAPTFVPEQKKVSELLREMQDLRVHMAIVVDEYGGTAGLVTIEDLIEEIVGEIVDEYDQEEPLVEPIDESTIRVDAKLAIDEVNELLQVELRDDEWDTVGGLVFGLTGRVPLVGETVRYDSLEFKTERVTGRRIQKVVISKVAAPPDAEAVR